MFGQKQKPQQPPRPIDGGAGRGIPLGGHDNRPPTGYLDSPEALDDPDFTLDDDDVDPADRRKDPLRR